MFLLVTGASGAGKSTIRRAVALMLASDGVECIELHDVASVPAAPTIAWRQQSVEAAVQHALALQERGRHLLLCGDPVAVGELVAAPSADQLERVAACLLDLDAHAQAARLSERGDDPALLAHHIAFADWMRAHARDPDHMPHVLTTNAWPPMRWDRRSERAWDVPVIDTSRLGREQAAVAVLDWARRALAGRAPVIAIGRVLTRRPVTNLRHLGRAPRNTGQRLANETPNEGAFPVSTHEVANARTAYGVLQTANGVLANGDVAEAHSDYHRAIILLQDWLFALMSSDDAERERAMERAVPAGIDPVYLATEPWMGLFRTARCLDDVPTARQAGEVAVTVFIEIGADSQRASDAIGEVGAFLAEQDDPEMREYGLECVEAAGQLRTSR